jgi:hypothetical protein
MGHRHVLILLLWLVLPGCPIAHPEPFDVSVFDVGTAIDVGRDAPADAGPPDARPDAPTPTDTGPLTGDRYAWVMTTADIPEVNADNEAPGFDLDGSPGTAITDRCDDAIDYTSPITGAADVDNQFSANVVGLLAGMLISGVAGAYEEAFADGDGLVAIVADGVDSLVSDPLVAVHAYGVTTESGRAPLLVAGRIAPGQRFAVSSDLGAGIGRISGGRLEGSLGRLPLSGVLVLPITDLQIGGAVSATALTNGEVGGRVTVGDLVALATSFGLGVDETVIRAVAQPDLAPNADGSVCAAISIGLTFEAVQAELVP